MVKTLIMILSSLILLHFNDTHSHLDPLYDGTAGVLERAAFIDSVRTANGIDNVLLLHAGDIGQGSSYFTLLNGDIEIDLVNAMGYDCITLGNHEFDNGLEELARRLANLKCPVVCANYDFSSFEAGKYVKPYAVIHRGGKKIGIIGLLTDITRSVSRETADRLPKFDTVESANKWASYLKNVEKCDIVIALSHLGFNSENSGVSDVELVPQTECIDLVVGGHSHTKLDDIVYVKNAAGRSIPIVQDWCWGHQAGMLEIR
ncbi:MAG: metallophosphoesterase [Bacteroidales bacterium]|nr:metallophosphoesterase [Bacteroidales bacterium]